MLPYPNLDDRDFDALMAEARRFLNQRCPAWTDLSPNDPGITLIETFAHLTEVLLYRLNRIPEKVHIALLNLLGVSLHPPASARVTLDFHLDEPQDEAVIIERGSEISTADTSGPIFITIAPAEIPAGSLEVSVDAVHAEVVVAELLGEGSGLAGQRFTLTSAPVTDTGLTPIAGDDGFASGRPLAVAVSVPEPESRSADFALDGTNYRVWSAIDVFGDDAPPTSFHADLSAGLIEFSPTPSDESTESLPLTSGAVAPIGSQVRAWYWSGGGPEGNVDAGLLTRMVTPIPRVTVVNPSAASGGRAGETLDDARQRGTAAVHSMHSCVTRSDYERTACHVGAIARAQAMTRADMWQHASPGEVEVVLVPAIDGDRPVDTGLLRDHQSETVRTEVESILQARQPLGTQTMVGWANVRTVSARVKLHARAEEDPVALEHRVRNRLFGAISPLATDVSAGWPFGRDLYASDIYDMVLAEPAVSHVERVRLVVDNVPASAVHAISADSYQPQTWFVGAGNGVFRTRDHGNSWEALRRFDDELVTTVEAHPGREVDRGGEAREGLVALVRQSGSGDDHRSTVMVSRDLGESWHALVEAPYPINDLAWADYGAQPVLLVAGAKALIRLPIQPDVPAVTLVVDPTQPELGFYAVTSYRRFGGQQEVAVASMGRGVFISATGGESESFVRTGLGADVRVLESQYRNNATLLWAGALSGHDDVAPYRMNRDDAEPAFAQIAAGWEGEGCTALGFDGPTVIAGSYSKGALALERTETGEQWARPGIDSGLPIRDDRGFLMESIRAVAVNGDVVLTGTESGVYRGREAGGFEAVAVEEFSEKVDLPHGWLFCSGDHQVEVQADAR